MEGAVTKAQAISRRAELMALCASGKPGVTKLRKEFSILTAWLLALEIKEKKQ